MLMFNMLMIMSSLLLIFLIHPISMGAILLIQTIFICLTIGLMNINYWYSYIMFLIMVGGLLILFIYMTSIASNEKFKFSNKLSLLLFLMITIILMIMLIDYYFINIMTFLNNMNKTHFMQINIMFANKYINLPSNMIFFSTILYLLITLIASIKISLTYKGPLRQNN